MNEGTNIESDKGKGEGGYDPLLLSKEAIRYGQVSVDGDWVYEYE